MVKVYNNNNNNAVYLNISELLFPLCFCLVMH